MPPLAEQHTRVQELTAVFTVLRLLTPLKMLYEVAKKRAQPYTKIGEKLPEMRRDTVELVRRAVTDNRKVYALMTHRAEGNAPLTIEDLADQLRAWQAAENPSACSPPTIIYRLPGPVDGGIGPRQWPFSFETG